MLYRTTERCSGIRKQCLYALMALAASVVSANMAFAAEIEHPLPDDTPIPVTDWSMEAEDILARSQEAGKALIADLTLGQEGVIVRASTTDPLMPGRYRLHALIASAPHDNILVESVAVRFRIGEASNVFERRSFPEPGKLTPVKFDFVVHEHGSPSFSAEWFVGDTMLDRKRYRNINEARHVYLAQRQNAINQMLLHGGPDADRHTVEQDDWQDDFLDGLMEEQTPKLQTRSITEDNLPRYGIMLSGLVLEQLTPVQITHITTDEPAYEDGADGRVTARLRNWSDEHVTVQLGWSISDESALEEPLARHTEAIEFEPGEEISHVLAEPFTTAGIRHIGRVNVSAEVDGLRPSKTWTPFVILPPERPADTERSMKVFAHYMGCYPTGTGATRYHLLNTGNEIRHERSDDASRRGGRFRNFDLVPYEQALTAEESADLEIRRAMRIGIDGFAVDAWAGGDGAKQVFETLLRVAEQNDYPFELTVCIDPMCEGDIVETVKYILDNYGDSPKLARRDGKPLIFGYMSWIPTMSELQSAVDSSLTDAQRRRRVDELRTSPLGWHLMGHAFRRAVEQVGQPIYYHFCMIYFFHDVDRTLIKPGIFTEAAGIISRYIDAIGGFGTYGFGARGDRLEDIARAVRESGAEWGGLGGMHQKENLPFEVFMPKGTEWLRNMWSDTRRDQATLLQLITWNDYTENTNIAPAYNTRYTIYDLTGYFIEWWKTGEQPELNRDRVYLTYAKYPKDAEAWPFTIKARRERALEVITLLTEPATVRLPGRDIEYDAPAGLHVEQFPIVPVPVTAELFREGELTLRLESPEPITDRPFREDNAMVCYSTEFDKHWRKDFGDTPPLLYSEYGDLDGDGLPNWFEMYWFTKERGVEQVKDDLMERLDEPERPPVTRLPDVSTATSLDPDADHTGDGITNLEAYRRRIDPTRPKPPEGAPEIEW